MDGETPFDVERTRAAIKVSFKRLAEVIEAGDFGEVMGKSLKRWLEMHKYSVNWALEESGDGTTL
jgi:hypothetical protein